MIRFLNHLPRFIRWILTVLGMLLLLMTVYRLFFFFHYKNHSTAFDLKVFWLGIRYDARIVSVLGILISLFAAIPILHPFKNESAQKGWSVAIGLFFFLILFFYGADFYHYDYLQQRLSFSVLNYMEDAAISTQMMWQTYPLVKISIFFAGAIFLFFFLHHLVIKRIHARNRAIQRSRFNTLSHFLLLSLLALLAYGRMGQYPLRWSDAFVFGDNFKSNAALNPFQSFFSSMDFGNKGYDLTKVKAAYPEVASYFDVQNPNEATLNFDRYIQYNDSARFKPNIVLVICESFSADKSSMFGNRLQPTPYFNELCNNGVFFERCFTPAFGTARGVWATLTGIPDVSLPKTSSRNPLAVDQHTIINNFTEYNKFYFLGGSTTWANIRGLLSHNIDNLKIYEEDAYQSNKVDVWGISDKNLFLQANQVFKTQKGPFFAVIQTADNHRPYTIPSEDLPEFNKVQLPIDTLKKYGFDNNEQFNAFRYTDFTFKKFIEAAQQEAYFSNTIFVFVGDHGIRGNVGSPFPKSFTQQGIMAEHVPLLFYAPALLQPAKIRQVASQLDILPSVAALAKQSYLNSTFGRNLFDSTDGQERYAFIADPEVPSIGLVSNDYYFVRNLKTKQRNFVSVVNDKAVEINPTTDSAKSRMARLTESLYETAKWMLLHNKKRH